MGGNEPFLVKDEGIFSESENRRLEMLQLSVLLKWNEFFWHDGV
jgi:hypothetical protein